MIEPASGRVRLGGRDISRWSVAERRAVGLAVVHDDRHREDGSTTADQSIDLSTTLADATTYVVCHNGSDAGILSVCQQQESSLNYTGDDAVVLVCDSATIDGIGQVGVQQEWGTGDASTEDNTLRRKSGITAGDTIPDDAFDPAIQWDGFANETFDGLGSHTP